MHPKSFAGTSVRSRPEMIPKRTISFVKEKRTLTVDMVIWHEREGHDFESGEANDIGERRAGDQRHGG